MHSLPCSMPGHVLQPLRFLKSCHGRRSRIGAFFMNTGMRAVITLVVVMLPALTRAQGTIDGVAKDASGAILPGVMIEVSSPALIEKTRATVTDQTGQYRVVALPDGRYRVTFALPGFTTVARENIEVLANFTAT